MAGGVLAPGGGKVEGTAVSPVSVFQCEPMVEAIRGHLVVGVCRVLLPKPSLFLCVLGDDQTVTEVQIPQERTGGRDEENSKVSEGFPGERASLVGHIHWPPLVRGAGASLCSHQFTEVL